MLFKNHCANCRTRIDSYGTNRTGGLPVVFCGGVCQTAYNQNKKMVDNKKLVSFKKSMTTDETTARLAKSPWKIQFKDVEHGIYSDTEHTTEELPI